MSGHDESADEVDFDALTEAGSDHPEPTVLRRKNGGVWVTVQAELVDEPALLDDGKTIVRGDE